MIRAALNPSGGDVVGQRFHANKHVKQTKGPHNSLNSQKEQIM